VGAEVFVVPCCVGVVVLVVVVVVVLLAMLVVVCWLFDEEACWLEPSRLARKLVARPLAFSEFGEGPEGFLLGFTVLRELLLMCFGGVVVGALLFLEIALVV